MANYKVGSNCRLTGKKCTHLLCDICIEFERKMVSHVDL
jgi:hypothetical protein